MHWATDLIGKPYGSGASGPDSFNCWGLQRWIFEHVDGIVVPMIAVGHAVNAQAIREAAAVSGWRPLGAGAQPAEHDIVLMMGLEGPHVGRMVQANGALLLLHCIERVGVCAQPLADLQRAGFHGFVFWRRAAS